MKIQQTEIDQIKLDFKRMESREDLLVLLNKAKILLYGEKAVPFELKQLTWYSKPKVGKKRYTQFSVKKKSGSERVIHAPVNGLRSLQKALSFVLQCVYEPHHAAMGFTRNRSIVNNAQIHVGQNYVYNIDLKDFFPSIDQARVWRCFQLKPFYLNDEELVSKDFELKNEIIDIVESFVSKVPSKQFSTPRILQLPKSTVQLSAKVLLKRDDISLSEFNNFMTELDEIQRDLEELKDEHPIKFRTTRQTIANMLACICCTETKVERKDVSGNWIKVMKNVLPQGAPTSPILSNIVCQRLDHILSGVANRFGLRYSRYADDITFSSMHNVYQPEGAFLKEIHRIIAEQGFHIKGSKTRLQKEGYQKEVTGLLVNDQVNVQKRYIKQLRMWLYYWERYGYERALGFFLQQYVSDRGHVKNCKPDMTNVIAGKLDYLKMVKGCDNELYLRLKGRFDELKGKNSSNPAPIIESIGEHGTRNETSNVKITLEVYQSPEMNEKLYNSINIPKDTVLPSTIIISNSNDDKGDSKLKLNNLYPILHTPLKTVELLKYFTANVKDLKYSTHSWEEGKYNSYDEYIEKIKSEWNEINKMLEAQSVRLYTKIWAFLFDDKLGLKKSNGYFHVWGEKRLKFGWSSPELKIHMNEPGNSPFSCPIPNHIRDLDKKHSLIYFKDYADIFKNEIEFREDSNNFKKMILDLWESELSYDFEIKGIKELVGFSFFTDVSYVKDSIRILFGDLIKTKPEFPVIIIEKQSYFENEGYHLIRITQKDSFVTRKIDDPKFANPTGNLHSMINNLKNLADYSVISRFADGKNYRINYLTSTENKFIQELEIRDEVLGFTHEFKFYL